MLWPELTVYWNAFHDLSPSRNVGMSIGAIPVSEVLAYAEIMEIESEERVLLLRYVRAMDNEYLKAEDAKHKTPRPAPKPPTRPPRRR